MVPKQLLTFAVILFSVATALSASAAAPSGGGSGSGITFKGSKRYALLWNINHMRSIEASNITALGRADGPMVAMEVGMPFSICLNLNYLENKSAEVTWKGVADTPVEFYGYLVDLGLKATIPIGWFQPWIGAGYGWGVFTFSNPVDREVDNFLIGVYSRGSRSVHSAYGYGGVDFRFGTSGIRLSFMVRRPTTDAISEIGNQTYNMQIDSFGAGFYADL